MVRLKLNSNYLNFIPYSSKIITMHLYSKQLTTSKQPVTVRLQITTQESTMTDITPSLSNTDRDCHKGRGRSGPLPQNSRWFILRNRRWLIVAQKRTMVTQKNSGGPCYSNLNSILLLSNTSLHLLVLSVTERITALSKTSPLYPCWSYQLLRESLLYQTPLLSTPVGTINYWKNHCSIKHLSSLPLSVLSVTERITALSNTSPLYPCRSYQLLRESLHCQILPLSTPVGSISYEENHCSVKYLPSLPLLVLLVTERITALSNTSPLYPCWSYHWVT
jgi:hypothetical protein